MTASEATDTYGHSQPFVVGFDPLKPLPVLQRQRQLDDYLEYLRERDGDANLEAKTLSRREKFFNEIDTKPVEAQRPIDSRIFYEYLNKKPPKTLDPKIIWLLAASKCNRVEHYGVELDLELKGDSFATDDHGEHMTFIDLEEFYHTRTLTYCGKVYGLSYDMYPPASFTRWFAKLVVTSPRKLRLLTALCGELFGCVAFQLLWERADVFADEPEVMARMRLLVREILVDEIGHTAYNHASLDGPTLAIARVMAPAVAVYFLNDLPEFAHLAGGRIKFLRRVAAFDLGKNADLWDLSRVAA